MIDRRNWHWFRVGDLFPPQKCKCSNATELLEDGDEIAYIGAKKSDNGVMRYVKRVENLVSRGNCIVFIGDGQGSVGYSLYQPVDFIGSTTLIVGYNEHLNPYNAAFLVSVLDLERFRYSFGRKYKKEVVANTKIQIPAIKHDNGDYTPDWKYMEDFVKDQIIPQLPKKAQKVWLQKYDTTPYMQEKMKLNTQDWKWFNYTDLFMISGSKTTPIDELETYGKGKNPYVTTQAVNNGVGGFYNYSTEKGGVLTVDSAVLGFCSYQENDFSASDHVEVLTPLFEMNKYIALFLVTLINKEQYRYSYGRKCSQIKLRNSKIKLPVTPSGEPDWRFMEDYIKSLPFSRNIEPSKPNEVVDELVEMKKEMIKMRRAMEAQQSGSLVNYGTVNIYEK